MIAGDGHAGGFDLLGVQPATFQRLNPYSPNATVLPREAIPARLPRCILRYFTLAGSMA